MDLLRNEIRHNVSGSRTFLLVCLRHTDYHGLAKREDFCTIRSAGLPTVLDSICPKNTSTCDDLHGTYIAATGPTLSQEWTLIRLTSGGPDPVLSTPVVAVPRRPLLLQNVLTGTYATRTEKLDGPNVSLTPSILPGSSTWTFMYAFNKHVNMDCFCIVTNSANPCTLDHYGSYHINVRPILI